MKDWPRPGARVRTTDGRVGTVQPYDRHPTRPWVPVALDYGVHLIFLLLELTEITDTPQRRRRDAS